MNARKRERPAIYIKNPQLTCPPFYPEIPGVLEVDMKTAISSALLGPEKHMSRFVRVSVRPRPNQSVGKVEPINIRSLLPIKTVAHGVVCSGIPMVHDRMHNFQTQDAPCTHVILWYVHEKKNLPKFVRGIGRHGHRNSITRLCDNSMACAAG